MSRPLRLEYPGAVWHVTVRGNERRAIFRDDEDRQRFLGLLGRTATLFRWRLYAYVLMGNHYHLLLETPEPTLSRGMRDLNGVYTQQFNRRHRRVGHLFQGRFKAILVEKEAHLLELVRYVVLNPVRAGVVRRARVWRWSSCRATAGLSGESDWLDVEATLENFGANRTKARLAYRRFVEDGGGSSYKPWKQVTRQVYLGGEAFRREVSARLRARGRSRGVPKAQLHPCPMRLDRLEEAVRMVFGMPLEALRQRSRTLVRERRLLASVLRREGLFPLITIGQALGVGPEQAGLLARDGDEIHADSRRGQLIAVLSGK